MKDNRFCFFLSREVVHSNKSGFPNISNSDKQVQGKVGRHDLSQGFFQPHPAAVIVFPLVI
jgi:hypothetical protein